MLEYKMLYSTLSSRILRHLSDLYWHAAVWREMAQSRFPFHPNPHVYSLSVPLLKRLPLWISQV